MGIDNFWFTKFQSVLTESVTINPTKRGARIDIILDRQLVMPINVPA